MAKKAETLSTAKYHQLFKDHKIESTADMIEKWDEFKAVFVNPDGTFIPQTATAGGAAMTEFVMASIDKAEITKICEMDQKARRKYVKNLDKKAFGPLGAKHFTEPLDALCMLDRGSSAGVGPSEDSYGVKIEE